MDTPDIHADRDLQQQVDDLSATVRLLQQELLQLRAQAVPDAEAPTQDTVSSRRSMLKMVGGATAAGALVAAVGSTARPAAAT